MGSDRKAVERDRKRWGDIESGGERQETVGRERKLWGVIGSGGE